MKVCALFFLFPFRVFLHLVSLSGSSDFRDHELQSMLYSPHQTISYSMQRLFLARFHLLDYLQT